MRTLILMRHAKSSWDNPDWSDFERPLNKRGLESAPFMGNLIYEKKIDPDIIFTSPAKRALQTAVLVRETAKIQSPLQLEDKIYEASSNTLINLVSTFSDTLQKVILIGHNPGLEDLIRVLTGSYCSMPTAAIAKINLQINSWDDIEFNSGVLKNVYRPRDLMGNDNEDSFVDSI